MESGGGGDEAATLRVVRVKNGFSPAAAAAAADGYRDVKLSLVLTTPEAGGISIVGEVQVRATSSKRTGRRRQSGAEGRERGGESLRWGGPGWGLLSAERVGPAREHWSLSRLCNLAV